jgi:hypothetical protein
MTRGAAENRALNFDPLSLNRLEFKFRIFGPVRNQSSLQSIQASLLCLWIAPDRKDILCWRNVPTDRQIPLGRYREVIPTSKLFFGGRSSVSSAHALNSGSNLPPDPTLSKVPEGRVDNRFCILPLWLRRGNGGRRNIDF